MKGIIKKYTDRGNFITHYIDYNGDRFWYSRACKRTVIFRSTETGKEIKVLIYPCWPYINNYENKEIRIKAVNL